MTQRPKTGGRTKGTPNKAPAEIKAKITDLIVDQFDSIASDIAAMEPQSRVGAYLKLMAFILPRPREEAEEISDFMTDLNRRYPY